MATRVFLRLVWKSQDAFSDSATKYMCVVASHRRKAISVPDPTSDSLLRISSSFEDFLAGAGDGGAA